MNTALGDAFNLGWKLAYVAHGWASPALLDSCTSERMPVARRLMAVNDLNTFLIGRLNRHSNQQEASWLPVIRTRPFLKRLPLELSGLSQSYATTPASPFGQRTEVGALSPYAQQLSTLSARWPGQTLTRPNQMGRAEAVEVECRLRDCARLLRSFNAGRDSTGPVPSNAAAVSLVRPDFVVERISENKPDTASLAEYLRRSYSAPGPIPLSAAPATS